jgi:hypothetical protein
MCPFVFPVAVEICDAVYRLIARNIVNVLLRTGSTALHFTVPLSIVHALHLTSRSLYRIHAALLTEDGDDLVAVLQDKVARLEKTQANRYTEQFIPLLGETGL